MAVADPVRLSNHQAPLHVPLLRSWWLSVVARVALTTAYWWGGVAKLLDFPAAVAEVRHMGLEPAALLAAATIALELGASIMLIVGWWVGVAAAALACFTILATLLGHPFWNVPAEAHFQEFNAFLDHIGLVGGFILAAILGQRESDQRSR
jgi:transmembrane protein